MSPLLSPLAEKSGDSVDGKETILHMEMTDPHKAGTETGAEPGTDQKPRPTPDELAQLAAKNVRPDQDLTGYEWLYWYVCRDIYADWRRKAKPEDELKQRKLEANAMFDRLKREAEEQREWCFRLANLFQKIEAVATNYRKSPSMETADELMNVLYGLL